MNSHPFGSDYASFYDTIYAAKDYVEECGILEDLVTTHGSDAARSILDLGCGTGGHAIELARRGFDVVGIDRSPDMVCRGREKATDVGVAVDLREGDLRDYELGRRFDAAVMMFAVLGYQHQNSDVTAALERARAHLHEGGLLVFDVWFGPAVLSQRPETRVARLDDGDSEVVRISSAAVDVRTNLCDVDIRMWRWTDDRILARTHEVHPMRFFFEPELRLFLESTGFEFLSLSGFPDLDEPPSDSTWNVLVVARALPSQ